MNKLCFGIDVGGTTIKVGLFDLQGKLLDKWEIKTHIEKKGCRILPDIAETIKAKLEDRNLLKEQITGIGLGLPGPVSDDGIIQDTANLGWGYKEVVKELTELTGIPVKAANDANAAALGEMWAGGAKGYSNVIMVTLGTGVGGGIIINRKILTGTHGSAGEIGHMHVNDSETDICGCGNRGCLEQSASATGVVRICNKLLASSDMPSVLRSSEISAKTIFDAVKAGDGLAVQVADKFGSCLGTVLASLGTVLDPEVFVIGGGVSNAGTILIDYIQKYYQLYVYKGGRGVEFVMAALGNDAGIYGAAKLVLD